MALESKPLFHPEVIRQQVKSFTLPERIRLSRFHFPISAFCFQDFSFPSPLLPDFLTDIFCGLLGYTGPAEGMDTFTFSRERHVEVDGKFADAVLGRFHK